MAQTHPRGSVSSKGSVFVVEDFVFFFLLSRIQENNHELLLTWSMAVGCSFFENYTSPKANKSPRKTASQKSFFFWVFQLGDFFPSWKKRISQGGTGRWTRPCCLFEAASDTQVQVVI